MITKVVQIWMLCCVINAAIAQTPKILFEARKAQNCGDADWIIDADAYDKSCGGGIGNEANAQRFPTPAQSTVSSGTNENYWSGANSAWAISCAKQGWQVESLPFGASLTYGNTSNAQDLKNYDLYISNEPNIAYTTIEKKALLDFVRNGGGLFIIANHNGSDRNFDGYDALRVWNDFFNYPGADSLGFAFDSVDISQTTNNKATFAATDTLVFGPFGNVGSVQWSDGTTFSINKQKNPTVKGVFYKIGSAATGITNCMVGRSNFGKGKVVVFGDSSPFDDGTGDPGDNSLYNGWAVDASGNHQRLIMNATLWLLNTPAINTGIENIDLSKWHIAPNPTNGWITVESNLQADSYELLDILGSKKTMIPQPETVEKIDMTDFANGVYLLKITKDGQNKIVKIIKDNN